jgi:O-antigen/teichoic acid export membrane protein
MRTRDLQRILGRLLMFIGGEAMQSAFHLGLNLALLHAVPAYEYGIFALVMVIGGLGLTYIRSLTALPASICIAQSRSAAAANAFEITFGSAATLLSVALAAGLACVLNAWLSEGALAGGAFVGLWTARSHLRTVFFARSRQKLVSMSDLVFTLSGAAGAVLVLLDGEHVLQHTFLALVGANALGIAVMLAFARRPVRISVGIHVWRRYARLWRDLRWSLISVTITNIQGQGMALLVAGIAGPAAYAPIAAALVMFVPLRIISTAFANMLHPEMSASLSRGEVQKVWRLMRTWPIPLGLFGLLYGGAIMVALPLIQPETLSDAQFYRISLLAWTIYTLPMLYVMPRIWLEIMLDFRTIAILSGVAAGVGLTLVLGILLTGAPSWSLFGSAVSELIVLAGTWVVVWHRQGVAARQLALASPLDEHR